MIVAFEQQTLRSFAIDAIEVEMDEWRAIGEQIALFERMDSADPTAIIGLPLIWLAGALRNAGFAVP